MIAGNFLIGQSSTKIATYAISLSSSVSAATSCWTVAPGWPVFPLSFENLTLEWVSKWKKNQTIFSRLTYGAEWCITNFSLKVMSDTPWAIYSRTFSCSTPFLNSKWILKFLYLEDNQVLKYLNSDHCECLFRKWQYMQTMQTSEATFLVTEWFLDLIELKNRISWKKSRHLKANFGK